MEAKKKVDEAWKAKVKEEKKTAAAETSKAESGQQPSDDAHMPAPDFSAFISGLAMQTLFLLGEISDPKEDKKIEPDLPQARYTIDLIDMLKKKTEGNRTAEETELTENILHDLHLRYLNHV